jgi:hypothetical protein
LHTLAISQDQVTNATLKLLREAELLHTIPQAREPGYPRGPVDAASVVLLNLLSTKMTDAGLKELKDLTHLQELVLGNTKVTDDGLKELKELNCLKKLSFNSCPRVTDAGLKELAGLTSLESLDLAGSGVKGPGLKELKDLKRLRRVEFGNGGVTDEILRSLREVGLLHALASASGRPGALPASPAEVRALGLNGSSADKGVTDAGLKELKDFKNLEFLFLDGAGVTDAGLKEVKQFKSLHTLSLNSTAVTDAGLRELKDFKGLQNLYLRYTKVTEAGVKELKAALPRCEITR